MSLNIFIVLKMVLKIHHHYIFPIFSTYSLRAFLHLLINMYYYQFIFKPKDKVCVDFANKYL